MIDPPEPLALEIFIHHFLRVDTSIIRMDNEFPELALLVWLESSKQNIHNVRQVVCRTKLHDL
jgi:hypothetical protein